jgi:predicted amidohydrolase
MRVHAVQLSVDLAEPIADRVARVADLVRAQAGADLVVLPELWVQGAFAFGEFARTAQPLDGPAVQALSAAARDLGAWVHGGSLVERAADGRLHNTAVLLRPDGSLAATYRKIHLFGFDGGETTVLTPGTDLVTVDVDGFRAGLATCYDLRFPELFRGLLDRGAELVLLPAAWPSTRVAHWQLLAQARAVEEQAYVVACNTAGQQAGLRMGGRSLVVDPWGAVVAEAGDDEAVVLADLDPGLVARTRAEFPVLGDRRL